MQRGVSACCFPSLGGCAESSSQPPAAPYQAPLLWRLKLGQVQGSLTAARECAVALHSTVYTGQWVVA